MKFNKKSLCLLVLIIIPMIAFAAAAVPTDPGSKRLDRSRVHNVGNIWLRVSNYGFFGSGSDVPQYPSLEYPGGSGIDYLFQGALWFGAKKYRRDKAGRKLFWKALHPSPDSSATVHAGHEDWRPWMKPVIDTLTTVGFDGDLDLCEFLPAYNPLVAGNLEVVDIYDTWNAMDEIATASVRTHKRGVDDDGDGIIDEDFVGYTFPLRVANELPIQFSSFGGQYIHDTYNYNIINEGDNAEIWFPLGFMDLSDMSYPSYAFSAPHDDDGDGRVDEDGAPVSEQDFISYYYDYCPHGTTGDRDLGRSRNRNTHQPLNVRVRQMSYQWSYDYIKNLVYVEFNITNMNIATQDTLFDCAMGIYMDCDVGPQSWDSKKAADDKSGYVKGEDYEFAYTYDADGDGGLTTGLVGARVCTPNPEKLQFHCWYWKVGNGPDDFNPLSLSSSKKTANEKYWLITGRNPDGSKFTPLRPERDDITEYEQAEANDTRFLFSFYGDMKGMNSPTDGSWNLAPGRTMKIVIAVFPGDNKEDLKRSAKWAKKIYGTAQDLTTVVLPDTFPHYNPPEPPEIPKMYAEMLNDGRQIDIYWDNRSEFSYDTMTVSSSDIGWQNPAWASYSPGIDSDPNFVDYSGFPEQFKPSFTDPDYKWNMMAKVNPFTGYRLRHDFQGYALWGRSGSGSQEDWNLKERWDKIDTAQDLADYNINFGHILYEDFGGYLGIDKGLPNADEWQKTAEYTNYYRLDDNYFLVPCTPNDTFYGWPIYAHDVSYSANIQAQADQIAADNAGKPTQYIQQLQARLFKHPDIRAEIFDELVDTRLIPLPGHGGQVAIGDDNLLAELYKERLARRYYRSQIMFPDRGVEYYLAVTAFDRGMPTQNLSFLETGRDKDANMKIFFPCTTAKTNMDNIYVIPNPYIGRSKFDGRREGDSKGDKSRRLWFVNLPLECTIRIYTLAGDLVKEIYHNGAHETDILTISKADSQGMSPDGMHEWDLLSKNRQIIAPGVYLFSVENKADGKIKVGKFVIIK